MKNDEEGEGDSPYFELQLSSQVFAKIVRNRLKALDLCIDRERKDKDGNVLQVLDRIVIGETTLIQREQRIELVGGVPQYLPSSSQHVWVFSPRSYYDMTVPFLQIKQETSQTGDRFPLFSTQRP